jgi:tetratricopeptide (TPR) repeat protein
MPSDLKPQGIKKILYYAILIALPFLLLIMLEGGLHLFGYGDHLALFVPAPKEYPDHLMCNPKIGQRYFVMQKTVTRTPNDYFLRKKPSDSFRMFVLGASTAAGFPYGDGLMFSRILQRRLQDTFPERTIEIINTAMTAVNTYTLLDILDEIMDMQPDALLLYAGHNEYYGALGVASMESLGKIPWLVNTYLKLQRFKFFILLRNSIIVLKKWVAGGGEAALTATLMERIVGREAIPFESPHYYRGIVQYESNLSAMIDKTKKRGIPLVISELVSNLRDQPPFFTQDSAAALEAWYYFRQARRLENDGRFLEAKQYYSKAKDRDPIRFRAPAAFNDIIRKLAEQKGIILVPMETYFEENSPDGLIGAHLMLDHLHPNIDGYFLMAEAFYQTLRRKKLIDSTWRDAYIKPSVYYRNLWAITGLDSCYVDLLIRHLKAGWPFQPKTAENNVLKNFKPQSLIDTLVERIIYDEMNLAQAHMQLARHYRHSNNLPKAEREYRALFQILNEDDMVYCNRADILIAHKEHEEALRLLYQAVESRETPLVLKRIGQIHLDFGRTKEAIPFLERAYKLAPGDMHLLYLLTKSYAVTGRNQAACDALNRLKSIDSTYQGLPLLENLISQAKK